MPFELVHHGYGSRWRDFHIDHYEGYHPNMSDYHMHDCYEISLVISGNVKVLLSDVVADGSESRVLLLPPGAPHFITCRADALYKRVNLLFAPDILAGESPEWQRLLSLFGKGGNVLTITHEECEEYRTLLAKMEGEKDTGRRKLLLLYLLSLLEERSVNVSPSGALPDYVSRALYYICTHYREKITALSLSAHLGIGRTTLMTSFRKCTGSTLCEYLTACRIGHAVIALREGKREGEVAEECGFSDTCAMIRAFKRFYGTTPKRYLAK